jgi:heme exporter protein A
LTLLALEHVALARGGRVLFEHLHLALEAGGAAVVTGPNGAGKSSLIRLAAGLLSPSSGTVRRSESTALLGENAALDPELTLERALRFWARLDGAGPDAAGAALDALALGPLAAVPVRMLSTGQRRRAGLARVAASGAQLWLLDEPANGLDADAVAMLEALIAVHRARGGGVMVATHLPLAVPDTTELRLPGEGWGGGVGGARP